MRSKLLFLIVLIAALAALPVQANLVPNPSLEIDSDPCDGDPDGWWTWGADISTGGDSTEEFLDDAAQARTGSWYAHARAGAGGYANILAPWAPVVEEGKVYYVGIFAKDIRDGGSLTDVGIEILYSTTLDGTGRDDTYKHVEPASVPSNGVYNLISAQTILIPVGIASVAVGFNGPASSEYNLDDYYLDTSPPAGASGVHSPAPADGSKSFPGCVDLRWTKNKGLQGDDLSCTLYWNGGSADVNDNNFDLLHPDVSELTPLTEPNTYSCVTVVAEKGYYWRVDAEDPNGGNGGVDTLIGPVWYFSTVNDKPDVDAGIKQAQWLPSGGTIEVTFQLAPTVDDDGLPAGTLTYQWTDSGPGAVVYSPPGGTTEAPTATMTVAGDYILTLTVNDGSGGVSDTVKLRVHANDTTGLEARYDCEESNTADGIHDDYSGNDKNPPSATTRRGERMDDIGEIGEIGTTMDQTGGHNAQPVQNPGDLTLGGIVFDGETAYIEVLNSQGDPNINPWSPAGTNGIRTWADFEDEVSVAAWVKIEEGNLNKNYQSLICNGNTSWRLQQNGNSNAMLFNLNLTNEDGDTYTAGAWGSIDIDDGQWHHVMGTYDGTRVALYIDGVEDTGTATEGTINIGNGYLAIGHNLGNLGTDVDGDGIRDGDDEVTNTVFEGTMDEIRIHSIGLPWRSDNPGNPEAGPVTETNARSVISIYRSSDGHLNCGGLFLPGDLDESCYVDMADARIMAEEWLDCSSIDRERCDSFWK